MCGRKFGEQNIWHFGRFVACNRNICKLSYIMNESLNASVRTNIGCEWSRTIKLHRDGGESKKKEEKKVNWNAWCLCWKRNMFGKVELTKHKYKLNEPSIFRKNDKYCWDWETFLVVCAGAYECILRVLSIKQIVDFLAIGEN